MTFLSFKSSDEASPPPVSTRQSFPLTRLALPVCSRSGHLPAHTSYHFPVPTLASLLHLELLKPVPASGPWHSCSLCWRNFPGSTMTCPLPAFRSHLERHLLSHLELKYLRAPPPWPITLVLPLNFLLGSPLLKPYI